MRLKIILSVHPEAFGTVLPISYQYEMSACVNRMLTADPVAYADWLHENGFTPDENMQQKLYAISNLYIPKIHVEADRLEILVPRIQFWISFAPSVNTEAFARYCLERHNVVLGDKRSKVMFSVDAIEVVSPVEYTPVMEYMALSPVVVVGVRPNNTVEYLDPDNPVFAQFLIDELVERYERVRHQKFDGSREFKFKLLSPVKRKGVCVRHYTQNEVKIIGYMFKFRLEMDVRLQQLAYETGLGDKINYGFGYLELMNKMPK